MIRCVITLMWVALIATAHAEAKSDEGMWKPLFNGRNLDGWKTDQPKLWVIENEMLIGRSPGILKNTFLYSEKLYGDFELRFEVRLVDDKGNSGVQIRTERMPDGHARGYQVDIGKGFWGSLYHEEGRGMLSHFKRKEGAPDDPIKLDQFNLFEVSARGHHITIKVNGKTTVELDDPEGELKGHIAPQIHSGEAMEIQFKSIEIKETTDAHPTDKANKP